MRNLLFKKMDDRTESMSLLSFGSNKERSYGTVSERTYLGSAISNITSFQQYHVQQGNSYGTLEDFSSLKTEEHVK